MHLASVLYQPFLNQHLAATACGTIATLIIRPGASRTDGSHLRDPEAHSSSGIPDRDTLCQLTAQPKWLNAGAVQHLQSLQHERCCTQQCPPCHRVSRSDSHDTRAGCDRHLHACINERAAAAGCPRDRHTSPRACATSSSFLSALPAAVSKACAIMALWKGLHACTISYSRVSHGSRAPSWRGGRGSTHACTPCHGPSY